MRGGSNPSSAIVNGDRCIVRAGKHAGKSGIVRDGHTSATGHVTITVEESDGTQIQNAGSERLNANGPASSEGERATRSVPLRTSASHDDRCDGRRR